MPTIVIRLEPAKEVTKTESEGLNLSIIPIYNLNLIGALPCSLTPGFKEAYLQNKPSKLANSRHINLGRSKNRTTRIIRFRVIQIGINWRRAANSGKRTNR